MILFKRLANRFSVLVGHAEEAPDNFLMSSISPTIPPQCKKLRLDPRTYTTLVVNFFKDAKIEPGDTASVLKHCAYLVRDTSLKAIPEGRKWLFFLNMVLLEVTTELNQSTGKKSEKLEPLFRLQKSLQGMIEHTFGRTGHLPIALLPQNVSEPGKLSSRGKRSTAVQESFAGFEAFRRCTDIQKLMELNVQGIREGYQVFDSVAIGHLQHYSDQFHSQVEHQGLTTEPQPVAAKKAPRYIAHHQPVLLPIKHGMIDTCLYERAEAPEDRGPTQAGASRKKLVLFCSGSGSSSEVYSPQTVQGLLNSDFPCDVLTFNYRGFGQSSDCDIDDQTITRDTQAVIDHAIRNLGYNPEDIFVWGFSLGSIPAIRVACGTYLDSRANLSSSKLSKILGHEVLRSAVLQKDPHKQKKSKKDAEGAEGKPLGGLITYGAVASVKDAMTAKDHPDAHDPDESQSVPIGERVLAGLAQSLVGFNNHEAMHCVGIPTLVISGGMADSFCVQSRALFGTRHSSARSHEGCELMELDSQACGSDHLTHEPLFNRDHVYVQRVTDWFKQQSEFAERKASTLNQLDLLGRRLDEASQ